MTGFRVRFHWDPKVWGTVVEWNTPGREALVLWDDGSFQFVKIESLQTVPSEEIIQRGKERAAVA